MKIKKEISERIVRKCLECAKQIPIILYSDGSYRNGHYFGKLPLYTKAERKKELRGGTHKSKIGNHWFNVCNYDPKPYKHIEYWECPKCYWRY